MLTLIIRLFGGISFCKTLKHNQKIDMDTNDFESFLAKIDQVNAQINDIIAGKDVTVENIEFSDAEVTSGMQRNAQEVQQEVNQSSQQQQQQQPKKKKQGVLDYSHFDSIVDEPEPDDISHLPLNTQQQLKEIERDAYERRYQKVNNAKSFKNEGNEYFAKKQFSEAIDSYQKGIKLLSASVTPSDNTVDKDILVQLFTNCAMCLLKLYDKHDNNRIEEVIEYCDKAIELDKNNMKAYNRRAQAREYKELYGLAVADYKKAKELAKKEKANTATLKQIDSSLKKCEQLASEAKLIRESSTLETGTVQQIVSIKNQYSTAAVPHKEVLCNELSGIISQQEGKFVALVQVIKNEGLFDLLLSDVYVKFTSEKSLVRQIISILVSLASNSSFCAKWITENDLVFKRIEEDKSVFLELLEKCTEEQKFVQKLLSNILKFVDSLVTEYVQKESSKQVDLSRALVVLKNLLACSELIANTILESDLFDIILVRVFNSISLEEGCSRTLRDAIIDILLAFSVNDKLREKMSDEKYCAIVCNHLLQLLRIELFGPSITPVTYNVTNVGSESLYVIEGVLSIFSNLTIQNKYSDNIMDQLVQSEDNISCIVSIVGTDCSTLRDSFNIRYKSINILSRMCVYTAGRGTSSVAKQLIEQKTVLHRIMNDTVCPNYSQLTRDQQRTVEASVRCLTACCTSDSSFVTKYSVKQLFVPLLECQDGMIAGNACMSLSYIASQSEQMSHYIGIECNAINRLASILARAETSSIDLRLQKNAAIALASIARTNSSCREYMQETNVMKLIRQKVPSVL
jgi:tetratricopeptide (TPR) repeat protein